jgi:uncharacterized protein YtpQ (UPF0354 family)
LPGAAAAAFAPGVDMKYSPFAYLVAAAMALLLWPSGIASGAGVPKDESGFTRYVANAFARQMPDATVAIAGPLRLSITLPSRPSGAHAVYLDTLAGGCDRDRRHCKSAIETFVTNMSALVKQESMPVERSAIRAVLRTADYVEHARNAFPGKPQWQPIARPLAGEVWVVCVLDLPTGIKILNVEDIAKLGLSADETLALARRNLVAALRPFDSVVHGFPNEAFGSVRGDYYEASRLLLHDEWAPLAKQATGSLIVAVPAIDVVLYADSGRQQAMRAMNAVALDVASKAQRPISPTLFQWTPAGWEPIPR